MIFFIGTVNSFLEAISDGLMDNDRLIEIKCLDYTVNMTSY